jgi:hypothetical protein
MPGIPHKPRLRAALDACMLDEDDGHNDAKFDR